MHLNKPGHSGEQLCFLRPTQQGAAGRAAPPGFLIFPDVTRGAKAGSGESAASARVTLPSLWPALPGEEHGRGPWWGRNQMEVAFSQRDCALEHCWWSFVWPLPGGLWWEGALLRGQPGPPRGEAGALPGGWGGVSRGVSVLIASLGSAPIAFWAWESDVLQIDLLLEVTPNMWPPRVTEELEVALDVAAMFL